MAGCLVQCMELYRLCGNALAKICIVGKADDCMSETFSIKRVEEIYHAIFHSACVEMVDDMHDQRWINLSCTHCPAT